jgi:hypothetical protein
LSLFKEKGPEWIHPGPFAFAGCVWRPEAPGLYSAFCSPTVAGGGTFRSSSTSEAAGMK